MLKELIGWALLFAILWGAYSLFFNQPVAQPAQLTYTDFVAKVQAGEVKDVKFAISDVVQTGTGTLKDGTKFTTIAPLYDASLYPLLIAKGVQGDFNKAQTSIWLTLLINVLPFVLLIGFWFFMMQRMQGGQNNQVFGFGKSKAKLFMDNRPRVTFKDVAGLDEAKEETGELIDYLKNPKKFSAMGAQIPKGALLVGPPGCGKTLLARAISGEAKVPFFNVSGSEFVEMFVGVGASRVRDLFAQAKQYAPCIVFIDEIDAVGRHRGAGIGGGNDEREQTLNQLLVEMDGFDANKGIIILAATNRPDVLDPALLRPGRFDRRVVVDLPDAKGREEILKVHASDKPFAVDVRLGTIAKETAGFTGADLENLLNESALLAVRRGKTDITMEEVEEAIDKVIAGPQKKSRVISADERRRIAYHESGHAVVGKALAAREEVHRISIVSRGMALGFTLQLPTEDRYMRTSEELLREVAGLLGGSASEKLFLGSISTGPSNDLERATDVVHRMIRAYGMSEKLGPLTYGKTSDLVFLGKELSEERNYSEETAQTIDAEARRLVEEQYRRATEVLEMNRAVLENLVTVLLDKETLQGPELEVALRGVIDLTASTVHIQAPASQSGSPVSTQPAS
ncbi:ATP-dependent metallopeptidase FtsH/Yme1/Tma family protein [Candidatus Cryosericum septentrionale]|uniref:ATP-dependent zinc metalloprotease FtsH n=1 Tax=Candidatus Cryosericum septentrionale TaxID=2290913 RepID=A0A398DSS3_9BACT|nr:ATP-dependent metallopeptidase FtsH/Yme1/Tma family protein [Candidatus Cryosericum septentrionale]